MSIEPISTTMTYQATNTPQARPSEEKASESAEKNVISQEAIAAEPKVAETAAANGEGSENGQGTAGEQARQNTEAQNEQIKKAVDELNKKMAKNSEAVFGIHEKTNRVTIKIVDKKTKDVIKELPPEKTLDMIAKVWELAGILVDEKR